MNWYYVQGGNSIGPVSQADFDALVQNGTIQPETLVWHEGLANWQAYSGVKAAAPGAVATAAMTGGAVATEAGASPAVAGGPEVVCAECNRIFPKENTIQYGGVWVCANCKPAFLQKLREGARMPGTGALDYAGFWIRFGAKIIDGLILGVVFFAPVVIFMIVGMSGANVNPDRALTMQLIFQFGFYVVSLLYNSFFLGKFGATPGKMACGLKVVMPDGAPITYARGLGRTLGEFVSGLVCNIGYIIAAFDKEKRALHDHIANTRVVRK